MGYTIRPVAKTIVAVPDDTAKELEEFYQFLTEHPDQVGTVEFTPNEGEEGFDAGKAKRAFVKTAKSWAAGRTITQAGQDGEEVTTAAPLVFRSLPSAGYPENVLRFNLTPPKEPKPAEAPAAENTPAETPAPAPTPAATGRRK